MTATANTSTITVASFNLIATIVGGGVLSVPYAFSKCGGAFWGILWMILAALATNQSCIWLCWCARPSATQGHDSTQLLSSYGQVGQAAFGPIFELLISALLFVFLVFVLIAYMVLVKDIWTPVVCNLHSSLTASTVSSSSLSPQELEERDETWGPYVLLATIFFMTPFLLQKTLHALRFNCYIGFGSVSILCLALCYHALSDSTSASGNVLYTTKFWFQPPQSIGDVITAFPILMLSFLCHFNVNPIQKALQHPTPERVSNVIHYSMLGCGLLMTTFGVAGYSYVENYDSAGGNSTVTVFGNILLNAEEQQQDQRTDIPLLLGRIGCGITIMLAMAIMILPCRDSLLEVLDTIIHYSNHKRINNRSTTNNHVDVEKNEVVSVGEETPLVATSTSSTSDTSANNVLSDNNTVAHYTSTFLIVLVCYISAIKVPGVAVVWSLCGSSMAFSIAFILPAACYLQLVHIREISERECEQQIQQQQVVASTTSKGLAWIILIVSIIAAIVCTTQTIELLLI